MKILIKKVSRVLIKNFFRNFALFLLLTMMISVTSGFFVVSESTANRNQYLMKQGNVEDGQIYFGMPISSQFEHELSKNGIFLEKMYRIDAKLPHNQTIRLYGNRKNINLPILNSGRLAEKDNEIALSTNYIKNNHIALGDKILFSSDYFADSKERNLKVVGSYVSPDYNSPFEKNSDFMFDNIDFGVGLVSKDLALKFNENKTVYQVSYRFNDPKLSYEQRTESDAKPIHPSKAIEGNRKSIEDSITRIAGKSGIFLGSMKALNNKCITYMMDDMGGDRPMMMVLSTLMVILIAFIFAVDSSNKIDEESEIIGTLLSTGYRKSEIMIYYMALPALVTFCAAILGNILGYTLLIKPYASVYYNTFNLPKFSPLFNSNAFILTTIFPIFIVLLINFLYIYKSLRHSPLAFLNRTRSNKKRKNITLSKNRGFETRFRLRIMISSAGDYFVMAIGIFVISLLLYYAFATSPTFDKFSKISSEGLVSRYQYILKNPVSITNTEFEDGLPVDDKAVLSEVQRKKINKNPEKITISSGSVYMKIRESNEEIVTLGVSDNSSYFKNLHISNNPNEVVISHGLAKKSKKEIGEYISIKNEITGKTNKYRISSVYHYEPTLTAFFTRENLNRTLDQNSVYFNGYLSNNKLDIKEKYILKVIDKETMTDIGKTLKKIMGPMIDIFLYSSLGFFFIFMSILIKIVINKSRLSIAYLKILGYTNREINLIYLRPATVVLILSFIIGWPIQKKLMGYISFVAFSKFAGYFEMEITNEMFLKAFGSTLVVYFIVNLFQMYSISKINYAEALKNRE
ncbi:FtsX-like permease family protein [Eubacteriales bacterium KG127]